MPNFKSIFFKMAVLQGGGENLPSPCLCYPKDPMWNRVKIGFNITKFSEDSVNDCRPFRGELSPELTHFWS